MEISAHTENQLLTQIQNISSSLNYPCRAEITEGDLRTAQQNKRYWGVIVAGLRRYSNEQGNNYSLEAIHEFLKQERFGLKVIEFDGVVRYVPARSRKMTKKQFNDFMVWAEAYVLTDLKVPIEYFNFDYV